jgi:hypothetical protein
VIEKLQTDGIDGSQNNNKNKCLHSSLSSMAQARNESGCNMNSKMIIIKKKELFQEGISQGKTG